MEAWKPLCLESIQYARHLWQRYAIDGGDACNILITLLCMAFASPLVAVPIHSDALTSVWACL